MIRNKTIYTVIIKSAYGTTSSLISFDTEEDAILFCEQEGWVFIDENNFEWSLEIIEEEVVEVVCNKGE